MSTRGVVRTFTAGICVALGIAGATGCYSYAVAGRGPAPNLDLLPIDAMNPKQAFEWQYAWGLSNQPVFSPIVCNNGQVDPSGKCKTASSDPCHGKGIGKFQVDIPWYAELATFFTLGVVSGVRLTFYCSTYTPAESGPQ